MGKGKGYKEMRREIPLIIRWLTNLWGKGEFQIKLLLSVTRNFDQVGKLRWEESSKFSKVGWQVWHAFQKNEVWNGILTGQKALEQQHWDSNVDCTIGAYCSQPWQEPYSPSCRWEGARRRGILLGAGLLGAYGWELQFRQRMRI